MNGMKFNLSIIFAIVLQGVALTWFLANQNAKIETLYSEFQQQNKKEVISNQLKMKLDLENVIALVNEMNTDLKKLKNKDQAIIKQNKKIQKEHEKLFDLINNSNSSGYSYGG